MKYLSKIAVAALLLGVSLSLCGEDNNPCLHTWGAVQYDCDTQVIGGSITVDCNTTPSEAVSRIRAASSKRGRCKRYRLCTKCGERDNLSDHSFSDLSCGPLQNVTLDPGGHIQSSAYCEVYATCHERRSAWGSVTVSGHDYYVMTDTAHRGEHPCHMTGHLPYDRAAVSLQTLKIPIGSTCYFWISWENAAIPLRNCGNMRTGAGPQLS